MQNDKIFIQIAAYRDPELIPTIEDCIDKAKYPERLVFGICNQYSENDKWSDLSKYKNDNRFRIINIDFKESKGACWARNLTQSLYNNESFTMQIDSHCRFVKDWDEILIELWNDIKDPKAILTCYPPNYSPHLDKSDWYYTPQICNVYKFIHKYTISRPMDMPDLDNRITPRRGIFIAAGFIFGPGIIIHDVPYDPEFYFTGEEIALTIRFFTNGYNIYHPHKLILHHYYSRPNDIKHWGDHSTWSEYDIKSHQRLDSLLGYNNIDLGIYGLGTKRTLDDYIKYSGVDFVKCIVHKDTEKGIEPPCSNSEEGWDNEQVTFNETISWDFDKIEKVENIRFWAMIVLDQNGVAIHREDLVYNENKDIIDGKVTSRNFRFDRSKNRQIPTQLLVWPFSNDMEWKTPAYFKI